MGSVSLTGADTIQINNRILQDFANGDCAELTFSEDLAKVKTSKNGNTLYALNENGRTAELKIRLLLGGSDDKYFNSLLAEMLYDFSAFVLINGIFVKRVGDGKGNISPVVYQCSGGVFRKNVDVKTNSEGDIDQSVSIYHLTFGNAPRSIQ